MSLRPLTQVEVEVQIAEELTHLEDLTDLYATEREEAGRAEATFKSRYHKAFLANHGTVAEREAKAMTVTEDEYLRRKIAEAVADSTKEALHSSRDRLSALQSLLRSIAHQT